MNRLTDEAIRRGLASVTGWTMGDQCIHKSFRFASYSAVIAFVNKVAHIAQEMNHHPDLLVRYGEVGVTYTSHDAGGLTQADFDAARAVDALRA